MDEALTRLGMPVPDSALARRARELIAGVATPSLVNHSVRVYAWAVELARHDRILSPRSGLGPMPANRRRAAA